MLDQEQTSISILIKGFTASTASLGSAIFSFVSEAEAVLRLGSLTVGIFVAIVTIWAFIRKDRRATEQHRLKMLELRQHDQKDD